AVFAIASAVGKTPVNGFHEMVASVSQGVTDAFAAAAVGIFLGFLFGIPRTPAPKVEKGEAPQPAEQTNLEQIADWLTKILLGAGLTQISMAPGWLWKVGMHVTIGASVGFTAVVIVNYLVAGFFTGYLLTRLFLVGALDEVDGSIRSKYERA